MTRKSDTRGFTLIELLVVIAIIGLLSSVILASLNTARKKGRDARRLSDLKQLQLALELYNSDQAGSGYPAALSSLAPTYIPAIATDPSTDSAYPYVVSDAGTYYCIGTTLESAVPTPEDICNGTTLAETEPTGNYRVAP